MSLKPSNFIPPVVSFILLVGIVGADKLRVDPAVAEPFHARVAEAFTKVPREFGRWLTLAEVPATAETIEQLKPNGYLDRRYIEMGKHRGGQLLLAQCKVVETMVGHFPPICYPAHGCRMLGAEPRTWNVGPLKIDGVEYLVLFPSGEKRTILDFFVLPNGKIAADMNSVNQAAKNYQELYFGVAHVQVLLDSGMSRGERDEVFTALVGANAPLIDVLRSGVSK